MTGILIYGATGYTGQLCAKEMIKHGLKPVLTGRSNSIKETAEKLGCPYAIFGLEDQSAIVDNLKNIGLVVNLAGPFQVTQKPLIEACLVSQCH